jgi:hypothetical protein
LASELLALSLIGCIAWASQRAAHATYELSGLAGNFTKSDVGSTLPDFQSESALGLVLNGKKFRQIVRRTKRRRSVGRTIPTPPAGKQNNGNELRLGSWGGDHVRFVNTNAGASVEFDCAHAIIESKIYLNQNACFDVVGSYFKEHAGPPRPGEQDQSFPARFKGCVRQSNLDLSIAPVGASGSSSSILVYGQAAQLIKCL